MSRHFPDFLFILTRTSHARDLFLVLFQKQPENGTKYHYLYSQSDREKSIIWKREKQREREVQRPENKTLPIHSKRNRPSESR